MSVSTTCPADPSPNSCPGADVASTVLKYSGDLTVSANGDNKVNQDLSPDLGGIGILTSTGSGDDQIDHTDVVTMTFLNAVKLLGVATLFAPGHEGFGVGDGSIS